MEAISEYKSQIPSEIKIGFIGCGNMAFAIAKGLIESKIFAANEIIISGTGREGSFEKWRSLGNIHTTLANYEVAAAARVVFLCVKPANLDSVARSINRRPDNPDDVLLPRNNTLVSILAGISLRDVKKSIPVFRSYVRAMPNTPLQVQAGCTALTKLVSDLESSGEIELNYEVVLAIFGSLGIVDVVDESKFHAITAVSGSGPAYVYIIIDALSDAGVKQGLPRDIATRFAAQTLFGASKTVLESGLHCGQLKDQVTSSGGTTIHAIHELERGGIRNTLFNCIEAATKRSKEMSEN